MGKRTNNTGRSVVIPAPNMRINQISIPQFMRNTLTLPLIITNETVLTDFDITHVVVKNRKNPVSYDLIRNSNYVIPIGATVLRKLRVGDHVLVNRQPSLRLQNILYLEIGEFNDNYTIGINLALTEGFGADFDGDEMNIWVLQNKYAHKEALKTLIPEKNKINLATGSCIWSHTQDIRLGNYILNNGIYNECSYEQQLKAYETVTNTGCSIQLTDRTGMEQMVLATSKGKPKNIEQIYSNVGQMLIGGEEVKSIALSDCSLNGFITESYKDGLNVGSYIQHAAAANEGIINTSQLTRESGYLGRCLNHLMVNSDSSLNDDDNIKQQRESLKGSILFGQTITQSALSSFHSTG